MWHLHRYTFSNFAMTSKFSVNKFNRTDQTRCIVLHIPTPWGHNKGMTVKGN
jgi:hypothetical protein